MFYQKRAFQETQEAEYQDNQKVDKFSSMELDHLNRSSVVLMIDITDHTGMIKQCTAILLQELARPLEERSQRKYSSYQTHCAL